VDRPDHEESDVLPDPQTERAVTPFPGPRVARVPTVAALLPEPRVAMVGTAAAPTVLDAAELTLLVRLPSPSSVETIARELAVPATEVRDRMRTIYRKLGVSSRRTAVAAAAERGLLG
jgi:ATP/maltotriose-dependent transcriptional regulator MalT